MTRYGLAAWLMMGVAAGLAAGQSDPKANAPATIVFHFEHAGLPVPVFTVTLREDGTGTYAATVVAPPVAHVADPAAVHEPDREVSQEIAVSAATTAKLFEEIRSTNHFRARCDSNAKNVAFTGSKTLEYTGSDGHAACTYNYTENKPIVSVTETFEGMEEMLEFGARLEHELRYDRLGLDAEMLKLVQAIKDKQAIEPLVIAPVLKAIAEDSQVIERVRVQAAKLLAMR